MSVTPAARQSNKHTDQAQLQDAWLRLLACYGVAPETAAAAFDDLAREYGGPGRYYHTLQHIGEVLATLESLGEGAQDLSAIQLAAWFHDVIYDPQASDNEAQSAAYAAQALRALAVPDVTIGRVCAMILATQAHECPPEDYDTQLLLDADLAVLAADGPAYQRYSQAIRAEYAWVPDDLYRPARRQVLQHFLARARIYQTPALFAALEARARRNIAAEIATLA